MGEILGVRKQVWSGLSCLRTEVEWQAHGYGKTHAKNECQKAKKSELTTDCCNEISVNSSPV